MSAPGICRAETSKKKKALKKYFMTIISGMQINTFHYVGDRLINIGDSFTRALGLFPTYGVTLNPQ